MSNIDRLSDREGSMLARSPPARYLSVTESSVTLPPEREGDSIMTILRPLCPTCQTRTVLARVTPALWLRHSDLRMPCVQTRSSDCGWPADRPDEACHNAHMATRPTASADITAASVNGLKSYALAHRLRNSRKATISSPPEED